MYNALPCDLPESKEAVTGRVTCKEDEREEKPGQPVSSMFHHAIGSEEDFTIKCTKLLHSHAISLSS
jgi:hypothetical protein